MREFFTLIRQAINKLLARLSYKLFTSLTNKPCISHFNFLIITFNADHCWVFTIFFLILADFSPIHALNRHLMRTHLNDNKERKIHSLRVIIAIIKQIYIQSSEYLRCYQLPFFFRSLSSSISFSRALFLSFLTCIIIRG